MNVMHINYSYNSISVVPDNRYFPRNLLSLDISFNKLNNFGDVNWKDMQNLRFLNFSNNDFELIPSTLQLPPFLVHLDLSFNKISKIPVNTFYYGSLLQDLNLHGNKLVYNRSVFYTDIFKNLSQLETLDIGSNACWVGEFSDAVFETLLKLKNLIVDGTQKSLFGKCFLKLKKLTSLKLQYCGIKEITENYFENLISLQNLDISRPKAPSEKPFLDWVYSGAIAKLKNLKFLDISYNFMLGMCAFRNITGDLPNTAIEIFKARKINCPYGLSTFLAIDDLKPLKKTKLRELYLDENRLEMAEDFSAIYLPKSLEILSLTQNRLRLEKYKVDGIYKLTGLQSLDISFQDGAHQIRDVAEWHLCDDFKKTVHCISDRVKTITFDSCKESEKRQHTGNTRYQHYTLPMHNEEIVRDTPYPYFEPNNCSFDGEYYYFTIIPPNTKVLKFQQSNLGEVVYPQFVSNDSLHQIYLNGNSFRYFLGPVCNVSKVTILDLSNNMCFNISSYFFIGFTALQELYLQGNKLGEVIDRFQNGEIFQSQSDLRILHLASNRIQTLPEKLLVNIHNLEVLNISFNLLTDFNLSISHLKNIKFIDLSFNQITFLSETSLNKLSNLFITRLKINMLQNNFECSCDSFAFLRWCDKHSYMLVYYENYTCRYKEKKNIGISDAILKLEIQCLSKIGIIAAVSACIILVIGIIIGSILYRYRWHMRYWFYVIKRKYLNQYEPLRDVTDYCFDAFVSYADEDRTFVFKDMTGYLEKVCQRKLCIHHRDFIPGTDIADNIINAVHQSRKTICLLSDAFFKSEWCKFELKMAQIEGVMSRDGENIIIIVMLQDLQSNALPDSLIENIKDVTYLPYFDFDHFREDICKNLNKALDF